MAKPLITVEIDTLGFNRWLTRQARQQIPFATAVALTETAKGARQKLQDTAKATMTIRNPGVLKGFSYRPAMKRDGLDRMASEVGTRDWFMAEQTADDTTLRQPLKAQFRSIPLSGIRKGKTGRIGPAKRAMAMLKKKGVFLEKNKRGKLIMYQRKGKKGVIPLYRLTKKQPIVPAFSFNTVTTEFANRTMQRNFIRAMHRALSTAR